jgi:hypothetical protein
MFSLFIVPQEVVQEMVEDVIVKVTHVLGAKVV